MPRYGQYQIICFEPEPSGRTQALQAAVQQRFADLDLDVETSLVFLTGAEAGHRDARSPAAAVYFGGATLADDADCARIQELLDSAVTVVPVVDSIGAYEALVPPVLYPINALTFDTAVPNYEAIAARLFEALHLLRETRRLFISYRRNESRAVAIQLYEALDSKGFDVFLDTVSIRPGDKFQEELRYRLADVDVIVLLHTKDFMESRWTVEELTNANRMNVAILRLEWPEIAAMRNDTTLTDRQRDHLRQLDEQASLADPFPLDDKDFDAANQLRPAVCAMVGERTEGLRARALAARLTSLARDFAQQAREAGFEALPQPERFMLLRKPPQVDRIVLPIVGPPSALIYEAFHQRIKELPKAPSMPVYIVYDHRALLDRHMKHLSWLDGEVQSVHSIPVADTRHVLAGFG
jgi:TIR domain